MASQRGSDSQIARGPAPSSRLRGFDPALATALLIVLLGGWFLWQASTLREGPGYAAVGPRVFPIIVGLGFLASGLALLLGRWRRAATASQAEGAASDAAQEDATDWSTLAQMAVLLALYAALFLHLGFIISSALFLLVGARVLGSRAWGRDLLAGVLLSVVTYFVFTRLLGLELPAGPLEGPLRAIGPGPPSE